MASEITIPKSWSEFLFQFVMTAIIGGFAILAVVDLFLNVAVIPSIIWLVLLIVLLRPAIRRDGGLRIWLVNRLGELVGRRFASYSAEGSVRRELYIGFEYLGHRFIQHANPIDEIQRVEWNPGQASGMMGRDMKDWHVFLWFRHNDPADNVRRKVRKQILVVGPSRRKEITEVFGLSFVAFLNEAVRTTCSGRQTNSLCA